MPAPPPPLRLLLVEPHTIMRSALRTIVKERFSVMAEASTCAQALFCLRSATEETRPELAIVDLDLPDRNGIEATRELLALDQSLRIVLLVNSDDQTVILESMTAGALAVVTKNEPEHVLLDALDTIRTGQNYLSLAASQRIFDLVRDSAEELKRTTLKLRAQELKVLRLMAKGLQTKEIAAHMNIKDNTARSYRKSMMQKLGVTNAVEAVEKGRREKLIVSTGILAP